MNYLHIHRPAWLAVIFGMITPLGFATNAIFARFLTYELRFDPKRLQFSAGTVMSIIVQAIAILFWYYNPNDIYKSFSINLFWWGFFGSIINILGLVSLQFALSKGPAGPISAFVSLSNVLLTLAECFYNQQSGVKNDRAYWICNRVFGCSHPCSARTFRKNILLYDMLMLYICIPKLLEKTQIH